MTDVLAVRLLGPPALRSITQDFENIPFVLIKKVQVED